MTEEVVDTAKPVTIRRRLDPEDAQLALFELLKHELLVKKADDNRAEV